MTRTLAEYRKQYPNTEYQRGVSMQEWQENTRIAWCRLSLLEARSLVQAYVEDGDVAYLADAVDLLLDALSEARL